jgi:cytoskeletal protein RodZ
VWCGFRLQALERGWKVGYANPVWVFLLLPLSQQQRQSPKKNPTPQQQQQQQQHQQQKPTTTTTTTSNKTEPKASAAKETVSLAHLPPSEGRTATTLNTATGLRR